MGPASSSTRLAQIILLGLISIILGDLFSAKDPWPGKNQYPSRSRSSPAAVLLKGISVFSPSSRRRLKLLRV